MFHVSTALYSVNNAQKCAQVREITSEYGVLLDDILSSALESKKRRKILQLRAKRYI